MRFFTTAFMLLTLILAAFSVACDAQAQNDEGSEKVMIDDFLEGNTNAPDFPEGMDWLNTNRPLSLKEFRGKIVLLDFWTFCCINCMHVIPDLKKLEEKYAKELVVIGVHSAKFTNEKGTEAIRQAILRYGIEHPVVNDRDFRIWRQYGVSAWPSFVLINPKSKIIGVHSGEGIYEPFDKIIGEAVDYFAARGELEPGPLNLDLEKADMPNTLLSFPGKVKADMASGRLIITDSNNDRIIITDPDGKILEVIGSGNNGQADGSFEEAEFNRPQGTYMDGDIIYIADTENHLIRKADLKSRTVETILGCGEQADRYNIPGAGTDVCLNSPWDLVRIGDKLYIAMAGSHQ
ncbi:MAG: redoxin domain-containing protein, partial [candidate division Zixibacteria bacterium]|nr:redoxin domain-containing protein [candidate division Zixibacteria bacterium]NIR62212.1 redoxin domain-containing protein [candidate division Zixibacteria bacterium]NIS14728.1 redoxin domain-containing protein [candidate division Zixibacteria bacterium]NIS44454.1 redoxin domain-containing protein [candidate division Zixibacteria bacterium]NIT51275.1 redoxin domain-containing protein [candidate division Zixibacteria bacterium]